MESTRRAWGWGLIGLILIAIYAMLFWISHEFTYGRPILERPVLLMVVLLMTAGFAYLAAILFLRPPDSPWTSWWLWMLGVGLAMRLLMLPSTPMLEDDFYRYLWDGAVIAHGHDPYAHAPRDILAGNAPQPLVELANERREVLERVNHPQLRTLYPVVAEGAFTLAHFIAPWKIEGLRIVWLALDGATLLLLGLLLGSLGVPRSALVIYWWNPLLVKEVYNSAHMELVILPFVAAALLLAVRTRHLAGAFLIGVAAGAKFWPVLLLAPIARRPDAGIKRYALLALAFAVPFALLALPVALSGADASSGLFAYAERWQMNDLIYMLIHAASMQASAEHAHLISRGVVMVLLAGWILWLCRTPAATGHAVCERALWITAALFMLSPTQFPWYALWMLPMLSVRPSPGLLLLSALLPLYYLRFSMRELDLVNWFDYGVVWLQFGPALLLLAWEHLRARSKPHGELAPC